MTGQGIRSSEDTGNEVLRGHSPIRESYVNAYDDGTLTTVWVKDDGETRLLLWRTYHELKRLERAHECLPI